MNNPTTDTPDDQMVPHLDAALTALESAGAILAHQGFRCRTDDLEALHLLRAACAIVAALKRRQQRPTGRQTDLERAALADRGTNAELVDPRTWPPRRKECPW